MIARSLFLQHDRLSGALAVARERRSSHNPGQVAEMTDHPCVRHQHRAHLGLLSILAPRGRVRARRQAAHRRATVVRAPCPEMRLQAGRAASQTLDQPQVSGREKGVEAQNGPSSAPSNRLAYRLETRPCAGIFRNGETRTRTGDTTIFSRVLYQLSYLAERPAKRPLYASSPAAVFR